MRGERLTINVERLAFSEERGARQRSGTKGGDRHESAKAHEVADANEGVER